VLMSSSEKVTIIIALINVAGAIICAWINRPRKKVSIAPVKNQKPIEKNRLLNYGMYLFILIAMISTGVLMYLVIHEPALPQARITSLSDQAYVNQVEIVQGISSDIPNGNVIWMIVFSKEVGRYYPLSDPLLIAGDGSWSKKIYIGTDADSGKDFELILVLADQTLQKDFSTYIDDAREKGNWYGLEKLPDSAIIFDRITVKRQSIQ